MVFVGLFGFLWIFSIRNLDKSSFIFYIFFFFNRHDAERTCSDQLCQGDGHGGYEKTSETPGFNGHHLAGQKGTQRCLVQAPRTGEYSGENPQGVELHPPGSEGERGCQ